MLTKVQILKIIHTHSSEIKQYGVKQLGLFGSFVKQTQKKKSDVDILVEFQKGKKTFDNYMDLKFFLESLLHRKIDLVLKKTIKPRLKTSILKEVEYAGL